MFKLIYKLYKVNLLSPKGIFYILSALHTHGSNLMLLLAFASKIKPNQIAFKEKDKYYTYKELYKTSLALSFLLHKHLLMTKGKKVAFLCRNHSVCIQSLFAFSRLGVHIVLLNIDMSKEQITKIVSQKQFDLLLYDNEFEEKICETTCKRIASFERREALSIASLLAKTPKENIKLRRAASGNLSVLTGGTSGKVKLAQRKPSIASMLLPFFALLKQLNLDKYKSVYIAAPFYHGYGLSALSVAIVLQSTIVCRKKFNTDEALALLENDTIEIAILVPTMLKRMLEKNPENLQKLKGILCGGEPLSPQLVAATNKNLGTVLYNLYGTSEAGFSVLATPKDLQKHPDTIGRAIKGVSVRILNEKGLKVGTNEVGALHIKAAWSMLETEKQYVATGDMAFQNEEAYLFLKGRADDMIVSGGENVYPKDIAQKLLEHDMLSDVAVIGVADETYGKRLVAFVVPKTAYKKKLKNEDIRLWLKQQVARYQMPHKIIFLDEIPKTTSGKTAKKKLEGFLNIAP